MVPSGPTLATRAEPSVTTGSFTPLLGFGSIFKAAASKAIELSCMIGVSVPVVLAFAWIKGQMAFAERGAENEKTPTITTKSVVRTALVWVFS